VSAIGQPQNEAPVESPRPDPETGDLMGPASLMDLEGKDPGKHYVFVSRNRQALAEYKRMGYRAETGREGGVSIAGEESEAGKEIECMDHVLMSVSAARRESIEQNGAFGASGQKYVDKVEKAIIDKKNISDHFRGSMPRRGQRDYFKLQNETTSLEEEGT
jgi:hypothetical protein